MNIPKLDIFLDKKYWVNRDDNYGTLCRVDLDSDGGIVDFNTNINPTSNTFVDNLFKYLTARDTKRLITISRTIREVGNESDCPPLSVLETIENTCKTKKILYYNFIQNPFPDGIPKFKLSKDNFVFRFSYDNDSLIDRVAVTKDICDSKNPITDEVIVMCTKTENKILEWQRKTI